MGKSARAKPGTSQCISQVLDLDLEQTLKMAKRIKADDVGKDVAVAGLWSTDRDKMESIFKLMKCSLCKRICPKQCNVCAQGHLLCNSCNNERIQCCCFEMIDEFGARSRCLDVLVPFNLQLHSFMLENFNIEFRCENFKSGCRAVLKPEKVGDDHRLQCEYRAIIGCPFTDCPTGDLTRPELISHLQESHGSLYVELVPGTPKKVEVLFTDVQKRHSWTPAIFSFSGHHLLLTLEYKDDQMRVWFYRLERLKNSADECRIEMKLFHHDEEDFVKLDSFPKDFFCSPSTLAQSVFTREISEFMEDFAYKRANLNGLMIEIVASYSEM